ncbi:MAG: carbon-nitrogen hydrolase family protein [Verrucomicrobiae bacterium]|nr:carbon-nitrogen hydrolase family protein [Verrucomicrobiae bacterium]
MKAQNFPAILPLLFINLVCYAAMSLLNVEFPVLTNSNKKPSMQVSWTNWAPRSEISPQFSLDMRGGRAKETALRIDTVTEEQFGAWRTRLRTLSPGKIYKFCAWYRVKNVKNERRSVIARLEWLDSNGNGVMPPEYALDSAVHGEWKKVEYVCHAPDNATMLDIQLSLGFSNNSTVWWDEISIVEIEKMPERKVAVATVYYRPRGSKSPSDSVEQFCNLVETNAPDKLDFVCLPEGITVVGTGKTYVDVSEQIPGPTTDRLGRLAQKIGAYIVAGIYEKEKNLVYNTAVLIDRKGRLLGKYRKTHLPREEWESGITPGNTYPVFETEFGKIGIMICWDLQFPEPARMMSAKGAEIIFLPIWGGNETLARARSIENSIFLVSSTYDMRSFIINPVGTILCEATKEKPFEWTTIDLNQIYYQPWLGNMKTRTWKEWRPDILKE